MKYFILLNIFISVELVCQDNNYQLLSQAKEMQEKGDYLSAAKLFTIIYNQTSDSSLKAESLYRFIACGDGAAGLLTSRYSKFENDQRLKKINRWKEDFDSTFKQFVEEYLQCGIHLKFVQYFESYWVNISTPSRKILTNNFSNTVYGELVSFEFITNEIDSVGYPAFNDPHVVIERADSFLNRYPNSNYKYDVFHIKGLGYQTLWNFSQGNYIDNLTETEKQHPQKLLDNGVKYLSLARRNKNKLVDLKWDASSEAILELLKDKKTTDIMYFFGD